MLVYVMKHMDGDGTTFVSMYLSVTSKKDIYCAKNGKIYTAGYQKTIPIYCAL